MKEITIPDGVTYIGFYSFYDCKQLTEITIPETVTTIGYAAFYTCDNLKTIHILAPVPPSIPSDWFWSWGAFGNITEQEGTLYVPEGSETLYRNAAYWSNFTNIVEEKLSAINTIPNSSFERQNFIHDLKGNSSLKNQI